MADKNKYRGPDAYLRYLRGELSERERHEFERDLEADPFLRDALEGLEKISSAEAEEDLLNLHQRLGKRVRRRRRIALYSAAAAVASLLIIGTIFLQIYDLTPGEQDVTGMEQEYPVRKPPVLRQSDGADQVSSEAKAEDEEAMVESEEAGAAGEEAESGEEVRAAGEVAGADREEVRAAGEEPVADAARDEPIVAVEAEPAPPSESKVLAPGETRKKTVKIQEPLQAAEPVLDGVRNETVAEQRALDVILEDRVAQPQTMVPKEEPREGRISRIREKVELDNIPEKEETLRLEMTALPSEKYGSAAVTRDKLTFGFENGGTVTPFLSPVEMDRLTEQPGFSQAIPDGGYAAFADYMKKNLPVSGDDTATRLRAVEMKLAVTRNGRMEDIQILTDNPPDIAEELVRLLKRGPDWFYPEYPGKAGEKWVRIRILY